MKMILKTLAAAAMLAALVFGRAEAMDLPAPMPEFRSPRELQAEAASRAAVPKQPTAERAQIDTFYTGKPQDRESGAHIFLFRNYDPELSRWTANDPSGFPDGANNASYSSIPTVGLDPLGLQDFTFTMNFFLYWDQTGGGGSPASWTLTLASTIASLSSTGLTTKVLGAVSSATSTYFTYGAVPSGSNVRRFTSDGFWEGAAPASGLTYEGLTHAQITIAPPTHSPVYWPSTDTSGEDFFNPLESPLLAEQWDNGNWPPSESDWNDASGGLPYPYPTQNPDSISTLMWNMSGYASFTLSLE